MKPEHKILIEKSFEMIKEENLPIPTNIRIRQSVIGTMKRNGVCTINHNTGDYTISIVDSKCRFYECPNGKYIEKKTGRRMEKDLVGVERTFKELMETMAHEIAHLKFWKHNQEHKGYTIYLIKKLINKLGDKYDSKRGTFCG